MANVYDYLNKYGDTLFSDKKFNEIDAIILSCFSYLELDGIVKNDRNYVSLFWALKEFCNDKKRVEYNDRSSTQKEMFYLAKILMNKKRYQNILLYNYEYKVTFDEQFGAISMKLDDDTVFVSFEGTDNNMVGWEEDMRIFYSYPVAAETDAIKYLSKTITLKDKNVIVGGHSKGGHLALIASMNVNFFDRDKISKIYSIDGLGIRKENIESLKYKRIENKINLIVSNYTFVGLMLRHTDNFKVVKTNKKGFSAHNPFNWEINDDKLVDSKLSVISKRVDDSLTTWLDDHDDKQRRKMCNAVFEIFKELDIVKTKDLLSAKKLFNVVSKSTKLDQETRNILLDFIKYNITNIVNK